MDIFSNFPKYVAKFILVLFVVPTHYKTRNESPLLKLMPNPSPRFQSYRSVFQNRFLNETLFLSKQIDIPSPLSHAYACKAGQSNVR